MDVDGSVLLPVVAAGAYRAELAQAVLSFKSHGQGQLAEVLSQGLARAIRAAAGEAPGLLLVPVPTSSSAYRRRGFSPVHVLLGRIGGTVPRERAAHRVHHRRCPPEDRPARRQESRPGQQSADRLPGLRGAPGGQKGLGRGDRAQRVRGSMRVRRGLFAPEVAGRPCIIVDDVLTTGATAGRGGPGAAGGRCRGEGRRRRSPRHARPATLDFGAADRAVAGEAAASRKKINQKRMNKRWL